MNVLQSTSSTSDRIAEAARAGSKEGVTCVAEAQTAGRGRQGKTWSSPEGENLLFSVLLKTELPLESVSRLTLVVGVAVREALQTFTSSPLLLKWPNDILADGRKLAGILVETHSRGTQVDAVIVGVGANVHSRAFPPDIAPAATSLARLEQAAKATALEREAVLVEILSRLESKLARFESKGLSPLLSEVSQHDALKGRRVSVDGRTGVAAGLDELGRLVIRADDGADVKVLSGTVTLLDERPGR